MKIDHQPEQNRFVCSTTGEEALLEYRLEDGTGIDFCRTFVPKSARGKGIAEELVKTGLNWARAQGYNIRASCSYVQRFLP